jgi:potassium uptake TrkH family protein
VLTTAGRRRLIDHPARYVVIWFVGAISVGTALLLLPVSTAAGRSTTLLQAAFTATSAVCVTGLTVVDTATHWSGFGHAVILVLVEVGGLGFMTIASLIVMLVSRRLGLRRTLVTNVERGALSLGDVGAVLRGLAVVTAVVQVTVALVLGARLFVTTDRGPGQAAWEGAFHSVMAFNNAGFSLYPDSLVRFAGDPWVLVPVMVAIVIGGLGFPVLVDLTRSRGRWRPLSLHAKVTITTTAALLLAGFVVLTAFEWANPSTIGPMPSGQKLLNGLFASVTPRTAGFNTVDVAAMEPQSLLSTVALMFVGAGSAGTSGGIKVGTFAILAMVVWSQLRGDAEVSGFRRRIPDSTQRQAITVAALAMTLVLGASSLMLISTDAPFGDSVFEAVSAFGTVGLSTGLTPELRALDQLGLMALMLVGRVGPITLGAALVLRSRPARYRLPEEGPLIG